MENLRELANRYGSDKGTEHRNCHNFTRVYDSLFEPLRDQPLTIVEIGLLHHEDSRWSEDPHKDYGSARGAGAPSLEMWRDYFSKAKIFGFDIHDFSHVFLNRIAILQGDSGARDDLHRLVRATGPIDIVIDDASHASHHQQIAFGFLFKYLSPNGLYIIEDLHWQPMHLEPHDATKTVSMLRHLEATGKVHSPYMTSDEATYIAKNTKQVMLFDSLEPYVSTIEARDALGVIWERGPVE